MNNSPVIDKELHYTNDTGSSATVSFTVFDGAYIYAAHSRQNEELIYPEYQETPQLSMYFSLQGTSSAYLKHSSEKYVLTDQQHMLRYTPHFEGYYSMSSPQVRNFGVALSESFFRQLMVTDLECLKHFWDKAGNGQLTDLTPYALPLTPRQMAVIHDMQHCSFTGHMKRLYYESKIMELFLLQAEQANHLMGQPPMQIKPADIDKLHAARHFVQQHMLEPITLTQVSRVAGLNDFKLKKGFKLLFGTTVFGYLNELRMHYGRQMLLDTSCTVAEVAYTLGYSEQQNFTKAFKKYFGYLPGALKS